MGAFPFQFIATAMMLDYLFQGNTDMTGNISGTKL